MTQREFNESILDRLEIIQKRLPNGEITSLIQTVKEMKEDISELKRTLLNPETGVIVRTNKNMDNIVDHSDRIEELEEQIIVLNELVKFRENVNKALWIIFSALVGVVVKLITMS